MPIGDPFADLPDAVQAAPGGGDPFASLPAAAKPKESGTLGSMVRSILGDTLVSKLQKAWESPPTGPSVIGFAKMAYEGAKAPGTAYQGGFSPAPEVPGQLSEADVERQTMAREAEADAAGKLASALNLGAAPAGLAGAAQPGVLSMNFARPGVVRGTPLVRESLSTPPAFPRVGSVDPAMFEASGRLGIDLPRFMADESRLTQGMAAGLKNIPGGGDVLHEAGDKTLRAIGEAKQGVVESLGLGSTVSAGEEAKGALKSWIKEGSSAESKTNYDIVDGLVNSSVATPLTSTQKAVSEIVSRRQNAKIPGDSAAVKIVQDASSDANGLTYQGIKDLRSYLGEMTPQEMAAAGLSGKEVRQLYGSLTDDLRASVERSGGKEALIAFDKANAAHRVIEGKREQLVKIIGKDADAAPESIVASLAAMAGQKSSANIGRLKLAREAMGPEAWNEVSSAVLNRMGTDRLGDFSVDRFNTAYQALTKDAKTLLFSKIETRQALDDIFTLTSGLEKKLKMYANPSQTAKLQSATQLVMDFIHAPLRAVATLVGAPRLARVLAEPISAQSTADWVKAYRDAVANPSGRTSRQFKAASAKLADLLVKQYSVNPNVAAPSLQSLPMTFGEPSQP